MVDLKIMLNNNFDNRIKKYKNIITINPYINSFYEFKNQEFKRVEKLTYNDKHYNISYITNKEMIITSLDTEYLVPDEELYDLLYMKAYEELGLDEEKEYRLYYEKRDSDENSFIYNVFITEAETIDRKFDEMLSEIKYIDLVLPAPLLFKTLYKNNVLENKDAHCYVYFTMKDAFVAVYKDGNFIYSKSLEYSLEQIYDKYCALIGEKVDKKEFFEILDSEGLKTTNSEYQQNLMKIFSEIFLQINDIVIYAKRAYKIDHMQKLFIGSVNSPIIGLSDYGYNYLGIPTFNLDFNFDIKNDEWYVDQLQYLMLKTGLDYIDAPHKVVNLSEYPRAPIFTKRASGQFILSILGTSVLAVGLPLFYLIPAYTLEGYNMKLNSDNQALSREVSSYKTILAQKQTKIKAKKKTLKKLVNIFESKAKTLTSIYNKKVDYNFKSNYFYIFSKDLEKHHLRLEKLYSQENLFTLHLFSRDEKDITRYIKEVSKKYFDEIESINIKRIDFNEKDALYRGTLKVVYR